MRTIDHGGHWRFERRAWFQGRVVGCGIFAGKVQEGKGGGEVVKSGARKGNEVDY
jgi:hypothetical protein